MSHPAITVEAPDRRAPCRYLAIEGPIGAGKTSLAERLVERWSMRPLLERAKDNPFLERFYSDMARYALPTQLHFALQRIDEAREAAAALENGASLVADYIAQKNEIFARITLDEEEWRLYRKLASHIDVVAPVPDLVVYLQASPATLLQRVQKRARPEEAPMSEAYLRKLADAYDQFFYHFDACPVLTVNTEHLNPLESAADLELVVERIETMRGRKASFVKAQ